MARVDNLFDIGRGKLGNLVFYRMNGRGIVRTKPEHFSDRKSPAQLAQRQRLQVVNKFLRPFRNLIRLTYAADVEGRTARAAAMSSIMRNALEGEYPNIYVDSSKALLSKGSLPLPVNASVEAHPEGLLIRWENAEEAAGKAAHDTLVVIALFNNTLEADYQITGVQRTAGQYLWRMSKQLQEGSMPDVWIAFRNTVMTEMSDSMYVTF